MNNWKKLNSSNWLDNKLTLEEKSEIQQIQKKIADGSKNNNKIWGKFQDSELSFESKLLIIEKWENLLNEIKDLK